MFSRRILPLIFATLILPPAQAETAAQAVYRKVSPFVVVVRVTGAESEGQGSGVIIGENEIATNCHVIEDAETIAIHRTEDDEPLAATLSRGDYGRDICILSVPGLENAEAVAIRKSKTLAVGEDVFAVGSPQGFDSTISPGIISQLRALAGTPPLIQTNAAISEGSSGGGLFDANGNLIGLTTFYYSEGQNLNFAVPTEWLEEVGEKPAGEVAGKDEETEAGASVGFLDKAVELERAEDWQEMLAHCRRWTDAEPWNFWAWYGLGFAYYNLDRHTDAIAAYREALRINPEYADAWYNLGVAYGLLDRYTDAIAAFREALRIDPEHANAWYNLGVAYGLLDRYDDEIAAYREALRIDPENAVAWSNLGSAYDDLSRYADAIAAYREALRIDPEDAVAWYNLGNAYYNLDRHTDAIDAYRKALRIDPELAVAWQNLGAAYYNLDRHTDAIAAYREALQIDPEDANAWYNLGNAYGDLGRYADVIAAYREVVRIEPDNTVAWFGLGVAYLALDRYDDAAAAIREVLRIHPELTDGWKSLSLIYEAQGRHAEADEARQQYLRLKILSGE